MADNNFGPYWTVDSEEVGGALVVVMLIVALPVFPFTLLGVSIAKIYIGNNFAIWGFGIFFFLLGYFLLTYIKDVFGLRYAILAVFLEYYVADYMTTPSGKMLKMQIVVNEFINWGLSSV